MKLRDLLSELRENILHDRSNLVTGDSDVLWSDATLCRYINEAVNRFARRTLCIRDATTPEVVEVTLATGVETYSLHPSIIAVISAKIEGSRYDLGRGGHSGFDYLRPQTTVYFDPNQFTTATPGIPVAYSTDEESATDDYDSYGVVKLRVYPAPASAYNGTKIQMRVVRLPINDLTSSNLNAIPEIPREYHLECLDWAAHLALRLQDRDGNDMKNAEWFKNEFERKVIEAKQELLRKFFVPGTWGFGQNGWSW
jgi:hypothetical protein